METMKSGHKLVSAEHVLDGHSMNQDLGQLIGYVWAEGNERRVMPSEHFTSLVEAFVRKYRSMEIESPKRILNDAHTLKRAAHELKWAKEELYNKSEKLAIHEFYMSTMKQIDRSGLVC